MFATFIAQSKFVTAVCVALSVAAFFVVKPWYYGLLAAIGVFIATAVVRVPFQHVADYCLPKPGQMIVSGAGINWRLLRHALPLVHFAL